MMVLIRESVWTFASGGLTKDCTELYVQKLIRLGLLLSYIRVASSD